MSTKRQMTKSLQAALAKCQEAQIRMANPQTAHQAAPLLADSLGYLSNHLETSDRNHPGIDKPTADGWQVSRVKKRDTGMVAASRREKARRRPDTKTTLTLK